MKQKSGIRSPFLLIVFLLVSLAQVYAQAPKSKDVQAIKNLMAAQEKAWNSGDLKGFMHGYWENDSLMFIGKSGITYGYDATLARYQKGYPDRATMGTLTFELLEFKSLGKKHILVVGKWHLAREEMDDAQGHFSLTWRKVKKDWRIVADHSS